MAVELRDTPATPRHLEQRLDLAVQLVKQAYSECPNLDLLIKAILEAPLYRYKTLHTFAGARSVFGAGKGCGGIFWTMRCG